VTVADVRSPSLAAEGLDAWWLPAFTVTVTDVRSPNLATKDPEI